MVPSPASLQTYRVRHSRIKAGFQRENAAAENQRPAPARHPDSAKAPTTTNPRKDRPNVPKRKCRKSVRLQLKQTAEKPSGRTGQVQQGCQRPPQPDILTAQKRSFAAPTRKSAARVRAKCPQLSLEGVGQPCATRPHKVTLGQTQRRRRGRRKWEAQALPALSRRKRLPPTRRRTRVPNPGPPQTKVGNTCRSGVESHSTAIWGSPEITQ